MFWYYISFILSVLAFYFYFRFVKFLPIKRKWWIFAISITSCFQLLIFDRLFPYMFNDEIQLVFRWFLVVTLMGAFIALCYDIIKLILRLFKIQAPVKIYTLIFLPFILITSTFGVYQAVRSPPIKEVTLTFEDLPKELDGLKIAVMADPHIGLFFRKEWLDKAIDKILASQSDLIVIVGDAVDAPFAEIKEDVTPYNRLQAPLGVYAIAGNHEYITGYYNWLNYFSSLPNITLLENAHKNIDFENSTLNIVGLSDPASSRVGLPPPSLELALKNYNPKHNDVFRLLLVHRPNHSESPKANASLQISGHTHGGAFFPINFIISNANGGFSSGEYQTDHGTVFVSNGMGLWDGVPLRLGFYSQIEIITLEKAKD